MNKAWPEVIATVVAAIVAALPTACAAKKTSPGSDAPAGREIASTRPSAPLGSDSASNDAKDAGIDLVQSPGEIVVKVKLTGITEAPDCGDTHTAAVMRYEVSNVIRGKYGASVLYAVFDCGRVEGLRSRVKIGDWHRLVVRPLPSDFGAAVYDDFAADKSTKRLLAVRAEPSQP